VKVLHRAGLEGASLLRVYTLAGDKVGKVSLAEALVRAARRNGLRGATVLPGLAGFGRHGLDLPLSVQLYRPERQPLVVEVVDAPERLERFVDQEVARLDRWGRLATLERLRLHAYHATPDDAEG
jgi:PII-like signaling protein